jgi:hypothetical protein
MEIGYLHALTLGFRVIRKQIATIAAGLVAYQLALEMHIDALGE